MPMSPQDILNKKKQTNSKIIAEEVLKIEKILEWNTTEPASIQICYSSKNIQNKFINEAIIKIFSECGWNVKYNHDQRDGDFMSFEAKP